MFLKLKKIVQLFLDIKSKHENNKFVTSVYQKPTVYGFFINFESLVSKSYTCSLMATLLDMDDLVYGQIWKSFIRKLVL